MGSSHLLPIRALPRVFLPGLDVEEESFELPQQEVDKIRKVLRLGEGAQIGVLPNDGTLIRCEFRQKQAWPKETIADPNPPICDLTLAQALPKPDRLETVLRMGTEIGVNRFLLFPAERSVVRWDAAKLQDRLRRMETIVREAAEQCFRFRLPSIEIAASLADVLNKEPGAWVLSELETETRVLTRGHAAATLIIGPEGGWAPREVALIGDRGVTLGPNVLRTDTAGIAAAAVMLLPLA